MHMKNVTKPEGVCTDDLTGLHVSFSGSCHFKKETLCTSFGRWTKTGMKENIMVELAFSRATMLRYAHPDFSLWSLLSGHIVLMSW